MWVIPYLPLIKTAILLRSWTAVLIEFILYPRGLCAEGLGPSCRCTLGNSEHFRRWGLDAKVDLWEQVFWDCILFFAPFSSFSSCSLFLYLLSDLFKVTFCVWSHDLASIMFNFTSGPNLWNLTLKQAFFFLSCYLQCVPVSKSDEPQISKSLSHSQWTDLSRTPC